MRMGTNKGEVRWIRKEKRKEKGRKRIGEREIKRKEKKMGFSLLSKIYGSRAVGFLRSKGKVDPRNESYVCVPKSGSFVKLQEVGNFPTWIISSLKSI